MTAIEEATLPRWRMEDYFPGIDSEELRSAVAQVVAAVSALQALFDELGIGWGPEGKDHSAAYERATNAVNRLLEDLRLVSTYIEGFVATDSRNDLAQTLRSQLEADSVELPKLLSRYEAWLGGLDIEAILASSSLARDHEHSIRRAGVAARHLMTQPEEDLAAELRLSGSAAWARLRGNVASQIAVRVEMPEGAREMPMSEARLLARSADPAVRRAAYAGEIAAWERSAVPLAAALNGVKGMKNTLNARRDWPGSLEPALFDNAIDRKTLEAMHEACREAFPDLRRYLRTKARLLGLARLPWWDLFAPLPVANGAGHDFASAQAVIVERFGSFSPRMADLARRAFAGGWVDAEPRPGKADGAFCMNVRGGESRLLMNFDGSIKSIQTLAHELGHAYHNLNLSERTQLQRQTPMTLAETASNFCQAIVTDSLLASNPGPAGMAILEDDLEHCTQTVIDIHSRFLFESAVFERRRRRELSVSELNELMVDAQHQTYGDGIDESAPHPYMWAVKSHYYGSSYYNFPYTFGHLFGLGLYRRYEEDRSRFVRDYDHLLSRTGMADAATLAAEFGIDIGSVDFWRSSLDLVRSRVTAFVELAGSIRPLPATPPAQR